MSSTQENNMLHFEIIKPTDFIKYNNDNDVVKIHNITDANKKQKYTHIRYKKENLETIKQANISKITNTKYIKLKQISNTLGK